MNVVVLAGGVGGARFLRGVKSYLREAGDDSTVTAIVNTADDITLHGLRICPDLDTVMYTLGDGIDDDRGWGRRDESFRASEELAAYGAGPAWFGLGDRDLATHLIRTQMWAAGYSLTDITAALCQRWNPGVTILPMSDDRVETHVVIDRDGQRQAIHFQEWWLAHRAEVPAESFVQIGIEDAAAAPGTLEAIAAADVVVMAPSNPVVSIGPVLAVPGIREALAGRVVVGVSPIVGGAPVRGYADACLKAIGVDSDAGAVARHYGAKRDGGILDGWIVDTADEASVEGLLSAGFAARAVPAVMHDESVAADLAQSALDLVARV